VDGGRLEWGSHGLGSVFAQRRNAASPSFLAMLRDVLRFGREAPAVLDPAAGKAYAGVSLGQYLAAQRYSRAFIDNYVVPMCAAVWSVPAAQVLAFPVTTLVRFWANHHLLDVLQRPCWRVVKGRSREYVAAAVAALADARAAAPVHSVRSLGPAGPVEVHAADGTEQYDSVVLATHADVSLRLLGAAAPAGVRAVLAGVPYADNDVWLHADPALMPRRREVWASWNCLQAGGPDAAGRPVCVSYWANRLQDLPPAAPDLFVTLNPPSPPAPDKVLRRLTLAHPVFGEASVAAQAALPGVQGRGGLYLAGAWAGYGFHEDGLRSAVAVVEALGGAIPWSPRACSPKMGWLDAAALRVFDRFARAAITVGRLRLVLPNGEERSYGAPAPAAGGAAAAWRGRPPLDATLRVYDAAFFRKVIARHDTGLGEAYMDGDFEVVEGVGGSGDLGSLLAVATANAASIEGTRGLLGVFNRLGDRALRAAHAARSNTAAGSRRNIEEHYDAGNDMYRLFLDPSMTYSCGVWDGPGCDLERAQMNKLDALIRRADIRAEHHVLEIGCGWGSFALRAAQTTGCRVTGLTVSKEQLAEAAARVEAAGLGGRVTLLFCDYRDAPALGLFDRVVSCEMIEAVGHEHLEAYFRTVGAVLKPGGRAVIQVIAEPDERYDAYCASSDFIREHVFPGGHLPSMGACVEAAAGTGLSVQGCVDIGQDYAVTLRAWRAAWEARRAEVEALGYPPRFWRKYRFYFAYCEAGFDARYIFTHQVTWVKDGECSLTEADIQRSREFNGGVGGGWEMCVCGGGECVWCGGGWGALFWARVWRSRQLMPGVERLAVRSPASPPCRPPRSGA
jgi:cyclopropane fatty-acyl-phospholipid synthase-like methyltransferase/predicted NAD/FAD-binding protein